MAHVVARVPASLGERAPAWLGAGDPGADLVSRTNAILDAHATREHWRHTPLERLTNELTVVEAGRMPAPHRVTGATHVTALADRDAAHVREALAGILANDRYPHASIVALAAGDGLWVDVARGGEAQVDLVAVAGASVVIVDVGEGAILSLTESGTPSATSGRLLVIRIGAGARVEHARLDAGADASHWSLIATTVGRDASYRLDLCALGAHLRRLDCLVTLDAPGASCRLGGAAVIGPRLHLDQRYTIEHRAPHTTSESRFHCIARGRGRATFNGRIHIHPHANGVAADLVSRNVALDPDAEINTKPELEIYNDDVRCSHGATIGRLDSEAMFYLASRGVDAATARSMMCRAFVMEANGGALAERARDALAAALDE